MQDNSIELPTREPAGPEPRSQHNLPAQLTPLIGREQEVAAVCMLMRRPHVRLLTFTGTGGVGKTRLALQVATELLDAFADGVCFVSLAPISDPDLVLPTIAQMLDVKESGARPLLDLLTAFLQDRHLLLVLDNFEQIITAAPVLTDLLQACPQCKLLVTSREVLRVRGEHEFVVQPLPVPDLKQPATSEVLSQYASVALFTQRAQAVNPDFQVDSNASTVAAICARLDGLPLALELAAARLKHLSLQALLARLEHRLQVLTRGPRDVSVRQQTLRNTIQWSYDLLSAEEQLVFRCHAVFVGGCTLEAVEAVCGMKGDVLNDVASLIDKNLVRRREQAGGTVRLMMLETIREFGLECIEECGEVEMMRRAHAEYYLALAEEAEPELRGPQQVRWLEQLEQEHDNLRATLRWAVEQEEASQRIEMALRLGSALCRFWQVRSHLSEGRRWLEKALAGEVMPLVRAKALYAAGMLAIDQGDYDQATRQCEESLALFRELNDRRGMAVSLSVLGYVAYRRGAHATPLLEESLTIGRAVGERRSIAQALCFLGHETRIRGEYIAARTSYEESLAIYREMGDLYSVAEVLLSLAEVLFQQGEYVVAQPLAEEGLELCRILGNVRGPTYRHGLRFLHNVAFYQSSDYAVARSLMEESLGIAREQGNWSNITHDLWRSGATALFQGDYRAAKSLLEEGIAIARKAGYRRQMAFALGDLGRVALYQGDFVTARIHLEEDVAVARELGDQRTISYALGFLAQLALYQSDWTTARALMEESLAIHREMVDRLGTARRLYDLGRVAFGEDDCMAARALYEEGLATFMELESKWFIAASFEGLAAVVLAQRQPTWAARLWGAAEILREGMGAPIPPIEHPAYERMVLNARTHLGEQAFTAAWAEGRAMTPEQLLVSLAEPVPAASTPAVKPPPPAIYPNELTEREVEVLRLVAQGLTNAQIAGQLVISIHTANNHMKSILSKLGVTSRTAATRFAFEHHLV